MSLTVADLMEDFDAAGLLVAATWSPAGGGSGGSFPVRFRAEGVPVLGGLVAAVEPQIDFAAAAAPALSNGDTVVVDGVAYRVRDLLPIHDGSMRRANLREATA